ncbi:LacI family DNA-binding transcriptional regulator [Fontisphaera persica]|uniref:LacI family DNA-binding transcriptional regulator n=1 Tax=Fontisphaera persica TaxID=2974023 RepID=UPI0024BF6460|nr:LacI family DNA-binding transcriptional regulator [Fontisphaera persica]WCJ58046.1 LacI family DNA-binding transcriptional regulator [Fontisphaera persica]
MVRLKDIAARAGVTVMTVSKVMHDAPDVSAATKARIRALAEEMGYMPNAMARGLRSRKTRLLGVVISTVTNPIFGRVLLALEEQAHAHGYDLLLAHSLNDPAREEHALRRMLSRHVDGLFLSPVYRLQPTAPIYEELRRRNVKTVLLGHRAPFCESFLAVETADFEASRQLTLHLLELGHRRIAYFAGPVISPSNRERLEGYRTALREAGIEPDDRLIFNAGATIEEGEQAAAQLAQEALRPTALMAVNDLVAIGAAHFLLRQGWQIPRDISIAGFGNVLLAEHFRVPLTTVRQPKMRLGKAAFDLLHQCLKGEPAQSLRLPAEVLVRQSTAPPPPESPS